MSDRGERAEALEESLEGYKGKINPVNRATLTWDKDLIFLGRTPRGYELDFDAEAQWGCIPTESLLLSIAGCLAIDCISFLKKMKCIITNTHIVITIHISGESITPRKLDRVIALSQEKYCSVYHSLRKDLKVDVKYLIEENV
jgi:putative redox protein